MTTLSFEVTDAEARAIRAWAGELGVDTSELLRDALRRQLVRLASAGTPATPSAPVLTPEEQAAADEADWGPEQDWATWADRADGADGAGGTR